jgi:hypothetical protein
MRRPDGAVDYFVGLVLDTERKRAEKGFTAGARPSAAAR